MSEVAAVCCLAMESDSMLLFLRAVAAAAMAAQPDMEYAWAFMIREGLGGHYRCAMHLHLYAFAALV